MNVSEKRTIKLFRILFAVSAISGISLFLFSVSAKPQQLSKKELEEKKKKIQQEIDYNKALLKDVKGQKNSTMIQVAIINNKIKVREELINTIGNEINEINGQISQTNATIHAKEEELKKLKEDYSKMVYTAYKNRSSYDRLMFIFSAADFNQAYQRLKY